MYFVLAVFLSAIVGACLGWFLGYIGAFLCIPCGLVFGFIGSWLDDKNNTK